MLLTLSLFLTSHKCSPVDISQGVYQQTIPLFLPLLPLAFVKLSVGAGLYPFAIFQIESELSLVNISIRLVVVAKTMSVAVRVNLRLNPLPEVEFA